MRDSFADRGRFIGSVNSVTLAVQPKPPRADGVAGSGRDHKARVVISWIGDAIDDFEFAAGTWANRCADRNRKSANDFSVFKNRQLAIWNADHYLPDGSNGPEILSHEC